MKLATLTLMVTVAGMALQVRTTHTQGLADPATLSFASHGLAPAGLSTAVATSSNSGPSSRAEELMAIEAAVNLYLEGGKGGDVELLREAFHDRARLQFAKDGGYGEWSIGEYLGRRTPGRTSGHRTRILSVDFAGSAAVVKAELDYGDFEFIDFLSLLEVDGQWKIVNKIFYRRQK